MKFFAKTDLGKIRQVNQDYYIAENRKVGIFPNIFIVADGVGSNRDSGFASKHCSNFVIDQLALSKDSTDYVKELLKAYKLANIDLFYRIMANPKYTGMGTTMVCVTVDNDKAVVANIGDSRCYHIRGEIRQVTKDHSIAEALVDENAIVKGSEKYMELKSQLSRAFGASKKIEPDFFDIELMIGDYILLCTDGLSNMVSDERMYEIIKDNTNIETKVDLLVEEANKNGGRDNIAIILIYIDDLDKSNSVFKKERDEINKIALEQLNSGETPLNTREILEKRTKQLGEDNFRSRSRKKNEDINDEH